MKFWWAHDSAFGHRINTIGRKREFGVLRLALDREWFLDVNGLVLNSKAGLWRPPGFSLAGPAFALVLRAWLCPKPPRSSATLGPSGSGSAPGCGAQSIVAEWALAGGTDVRTEVRGSRGFRPLHLPYTNPH
jgi:hypothetical protein